MDTMNLLAQAATNLTDSLATSNPVLTPVAAPAEMNMLDMAIKGGWIMIILGIFSVVCFYILFERMYAIRKAGKEDPMFMDKIKDKSVCIVLPTYNGGKYLAKQLDSILEQTWPNCSVYIRDDGSTDDTVEIAQWYCRSNSSIHLIQDSIGNLGCPNSFYEIIKRVPEYDYYAFADQDDIWKTDKIDRKSVV